MRYDSDLLYRPPGEWRSYLLQCTIGCSHNKCTFCAMYKEKKFRVRPVEEILEDIDMARSYYGPNVERVFLMDGDAGVMRTEQLLQILEKLYAAFPKLQKVTTYAGPRSTLSKTPEEMSKGMIDKLQISLVMARRARLYLLDEPIGGVDVEAREHVLDLILENFNPKGTMLIVTHLIHDIERLFDDVIVLKEGRVETFTASDSLRAQYGGSLEEALKAMFREEAAR